MCGGFVWTVLCVLCFLGSTLCSVCLDCTVCSAFVWTLFRVVGLFGLYYV